MKLITAIVNKRDASEVCRALTESGFYFTKIASSGGFLRTGNVTLLIGVEDEKVDSVISIIRENSANRMENVPDVNYGGAVSFIPPTPVSVPVGGATIFVSDVTHFEKM